MAGLVTGSGTAPGFQIQLTNSSLTTFATSGILTPGFSSTMADYTISYTVEAADPLIGQGLRIMLTKEAGGNQVNFDNVRLSVVPIPEPSTSIVLISGIALLGLRRRRA